MTSSSYIKCKHMAWTVDRLSSIAGKSVKLIRRFKSHQSMAVKLPIENYQCRLLMYVLVHLLVRMYTGLFKMLVKKVV